MSVARQNGYHLVVLGPMSRRVHMRSCVVLVLLCLFVVAMALVTAPLGSHEAGFRELLTVLFDPAQATGESHQIIRDFRLPRIIMAVLCGAMLGLSGAALQALTRNGLADPGLLGVKEGASLSVITLILFVPSAGLYLRPLVGMAGGFLSALLVASLARDLTRMRFVLIGIGVSWLMSAALSVILTTSDIRDVQTAMVWLAGSLNAVSWDVVPIALVCATLGAAILFLTAAAADAAVLGDPMAIGLGVSLRRLSILRFVASVLLTAACVSCVGSLGFVGLIAPHMARLAICGSGQSMLLAGSALFGAALVLIADSIGRLAFAPLQLPAGIVLAIVGVPVLLLLLWKRRNLL
ncbi:iron ABC transporter permease [Rhizobium sp. AP16]|uniref:FecCD family ABC transporter permease n=1 Tax=Rhizobium sp. AP16 TaxID=1144306 RepID=UPI00026EDE2D|nr:iron ABC transporter permease [Rhizobium sp. AP16]EJK85313.1 ABC-type Fe3+-siderophore transport system, permease component [Rhizobium sp. AP16]